MSVWCFVFGHDFDRRELNPDRDTDDGTALVCERCSALVWPPRDNE